MSVSLAAEKTWISKNRENLKGILNGEHIYAVFQPILSLKNGEVYGYEALSRISHEKYQMNIEELFRTADRENLSWELEALCRRKTLERAREMETGKKLFLNVNPNILYDEGFRRGYTKHRLEFYGLNFKNIIFEITERVAVTDMDSFLDAIQHYKEQGYGIAIDDVGSGYSGLNTLSDVKPSLIKLDMNLIRGIDQDETKQLLCRAMVSFAHGCGILVIAEGIETKEELQTVIHENVDFGQGYYLGMPEKEFSVTAPEKLEAIHHSRQKGSYPVIL